MKTIIEFKNSVYFNISHTHNTCICAISNSPVGVDIEKIKPVSLNLAKKALTHTEYYKFLQHENKDEMFFNIWTKKESFCKKNNISIFTNFDNINPLYFNNIKTFKHKDYIFSICSENLDKIQTTHLNINFFMNLM